MGITGAGLWWRGRRNWKRGFAVSWRARWRSVTYDLHGLIGVMTAVPLMAVAITGAYLALQDFDSYHPDEMAWQGAFGRGPSILMRWCSRPKVRRQAAPASSSICQRTPQTHSDSTRSWLAPPIESARSGNRSCRTNQLHAGHNDRRLDGRVGRPDPLWPIRRVYVALRVGCAGHCAIAALRDRPPHVVEPGARFKFARGSDSSICRLISSTPKYIVGR